MKHLVSSLAALMLLLFDFPATAANLQCAFSPASVQLGLIGDPNFFAYACSSTQCFNLGVYSTEKTKQFYAMSLTAVALGRSLKATFYSSPASDCSIVMRTEEVFALSLMPE